MDNNIILDKTESIKQTTHVHKHKKRKIINNLDFVIPTPNNYRQLQEINYKNSQLKTICRHYKLRIGGNKDELINRIYNYLHLVCSVNIIQRRWRKKIFKLYILARGPAYKERNICINDTDFYTTQEVNDIPNKQFISYKCSDGFIYGFDILSLYLLISKNNTNNVQNPYNRSLLPESLYKSLDYICKISKIYGDEIITTEEIEEIDQIKKIQLRGLSLFQHIQEITSYIIDHSWWWILNRNELIKFIRELCDIWEYRAQLEPQVKCEICPPNGRVFFYDEIQGMNQLQLSELQNLSCLIIERMTKSMTTVDNQALGANYVICALTLVSQQAADQFPWLYQSVSYV